MESNVLEADLLVQSALDNLITGMEGSFDSGYSTSPVRKAAGLPSTSQSNHVLLGSVKSPFKENTASSAASLPFSPIKAGSSNILSPLKEPSLSPFKLLTQSPSKGAFDDWDKELFSSLDENLFGNVVISDNVLDELLKSPQGKAYLESRNSPLRNISNSGVVRQLRISPETNRHRGRHFQSLDDQSSDVFTLNMPEIKIEPMEFTEIKIEDTLEDQIYGQQTSRFGRNQSVLDPNKMGETPVKPVLTNVENVPKRKLSMKPVGGLMVDHSFNIVRQDGLQNRPNNCSTWPSKERLKFARQHFKDVLDREVAKHKLLLEQDRRAKGKQKADENIVVTPMVNARGANVSNGGKGKAPKKKKTYRKKKSTAQTKGGVTTAARGKSATVIQNNVFSVPMTNFDDPCWYPSDDDEEDIWTGPPPFYTSPPLYEELENEEVSSDDDMAMFKYETISGRRVNFKKPKLR